MNKKQFDAAVAIARNKDIDLSKVDDSTLDGCALPNFKPVTITLEMAAKCIRWHGINIDGSINAEELNELREISRKRWLVCEE